MTRIIITSALPYANGPIHVGHLVEYIQTDIFVKFLKLIGKNAIYCCADDTHGTPIEIAAQKEGILPEELIGRFHKEHLRDFTNFHIKFDSYYSTNSKENKHFSDLIFSRLKKKELIYEKEVELHYCNKCRRFLPDRYIKGKCPKCNASDQYGDVCEHCNGTYNTTDLIQPYCTICGETPTRKLSRHYFFKLSALSDKLKKWIEEKEFQPEIRNYVLNWIKNGLQDWDISRDGPYFGFKIPDEEDKYYYVWLDAPIGYIASFTNYLGDVKKAEKEWNKSEIIHFIGKDIIYFHFLFWPAMLMESDFKMPDNLIVHGFLTVNQEKMSKSRGTFYTAEDFSKLYDPEYLRFYYAKVLSRKMADIDLNFKDFEESVNNELVANIGNFCYRVLSFLEKNFESKVKGTIKDKIEDEIIKKVETIKNAYQNVNFNEALKEILTISSIGNKYFQENQPWKLVKEDKEKTHKILGNCVNIVKIIGILLQPILPKFSQSLLKQLNIADASWKDINFNYKNKIISKAEILIKKIEIKELFPLNLRVAKVIDVSNHPNADKLYILDVDLKDEKRRLVAGLKDYYKKEEIIGKNIVVVTNLKPSKLRGIESKGMLLACENKEKIGLLIAPNSKPGGYCTFGKLKNGTKEISFENFQKIKITAKEGKILYSNMILKTDKEDISIERVREGKVC